MNVKEFIANYRDKYVIYGMDAIISAHWMSRT